ncbi:hypothetical protein AOLI_G00050650 [Acnodon oligacanthus]
MLHISPFILDSLGSSLLRMRKPDDIAEASCHLSTVTAFSRRTSNVAEHILQRDLVEMLMVVLFQSVRWQQCRKLRSSCCKSSTEEEAGAPHADIGGPAVASR